MKEATKISREIKRLGKRYRLRELNDYGEQVEFYLDNLQLKNLTRIIPSYEGTVDNIRHEFDRARKHS